MRSITSSVMGDITAVNERLLSARKDLLQAACLADYHARSGEAHAFNAAWRDAVGRGRGGKWRAIEGKKALLRIAPELDLRELWTLA